jgi:formimidoylglutamate deiminase
MTTIFARLALTSDGWARNARITVDGRKIAAVDADSCAEEDDVEVGVVIPGLANAHSHAFQRALAGHTEQRGPGGKDNFWTWRARMYALAGRVDAAALEIVARQAYTEMVATGFTAVAEFHYLHNQPGESGPSEAMFEALAAAAEFSGIRLTYVPVLYERAGFDNPEPNEEQRRFVRHCEEFIEHYETVSASCREGVRTGIGAHSLRAVSPASLKRVAAIAARDGAPMHLHIAEQLREAEDCVAVLGKRPVEWLLDNFDIDEHWCLVHATHTDIEEQAAIAECGAVVCLCPSTEANLGDGLFKLQHFLEQGGRIAIGSDSHVTINPFEELRWLEYGQRLVRQMRNIAAVRRPETGRSLFELALAGGAAACGNDKRHIVEGANADLIALDDDSPMLAGHTTKSLLDALVFSGFTLPIDRVMVNGDWKVTDGMHRGAEDAREAYTDLVKHLDLESVVA